MTEKRTLSRGLRIVQGNPVQKLSIPAAVELS
jgi:hypothetical protein